MNILTVFQPGWKAVGIAAVIGVAVGAWGGYHFTSKSLNADIAQLNSEHATALRTVSDDASATRDKNAALEHAFANSLARSDQQRTQELNNALTENQALRDAVSTGASKLQLAKAGLAACNLSKGSASGTASVDNVATVEFSNEFGRSIYDIRAGAISDQQKLSALQDYIRSAQAAGVIAK